MKSGTDIHTSNTLSPNDFGEPQTFPLALRGGRNNYKIGLVKQPHTAIFYFLSYKTLVFIKRLQKHQHKRGNITVQSTLLN